LKAPGFNPEAYEVEIWFQAFAFKSNSYRYKAGAPPGTRFTVPILWDKKTERVVSNESSEIIRDLNACFNDFAEKPKMDLYPEVGLY
jgi:glutathionyl-hydroquinone reductase